MPAIQVLWDDGWLWGPQIARLLESFEHSMTSKSADCMDQHEQSHAPQKAFSKVIVDAAAMTAVSSVIASGIQQYNNFVEERLEKRTKPIKKPLWKNKLHMFVQQRKAQKSSLTILPNSYSLFSFLFKLWIYSVLPEHWINCDFWIDSLHISRGFH